MKAQEISELSIEEISKKVRDSRQELLDLKLRQQQGQLEKTHEIKLLRREIARCETVLAQKKAAVAAG
jgi:large subunit ribosomal protein L29